MTREEALTKLKDLKEASDLWDCVEESKALGMAIEALSKIADITQRDLCADISCTDCPFMKETCKLMDYVAYADRPHGKWISKIDTGTWMLECSVCGCRVQEEKYRIAVGENATRCPYCGAELGLGGYLYDEYANRPSQRKGEDE